MSWLSFRQNIVAWNILKSLCTSMDLYLANHDHGKPRWRYINSHANHMWRHYQPFHNITRGLSKLVFYENNNLSLLLFQRVYMYILFRIWISPVSFFFKLALINVISCHVWTHTVAKRAPVAKHLSTDQHRKGHWGTEAWSFSLAREFLFNISSIRVFKFEGNFVYTLDTLHRRESFYLLFFWQKRVLSDIDSRWAMYFQDIEISIVYTLSGVIWGTEPKHNIVCLVCPRIVAFFELYKCHGLSLLSLSVTRTVGLVNYAASPTVWLMSHAVSPTAWLMSHAVSPTVWLMNLVVSPTVGLANPVVSLTVGLRRCVVSSTISRTICKHISPTAGLTVSSTSTYVTATASRTTQAST